MNVTSKRGNQRKIRSQANVERNRTSIGGNVELRYEGMPERGFDRITKAT